MKFENTEVWGFKHALRGMRNPKNSWHLSDSDEYMSFLDVPQAEETAKHIGQKACGAGIGVHIGSNDLKLAQTLVRAGSEHRKFMRQIFVSVDITAPLYWWKEFDTYKVGTVANSTSTMHKLAETPITIDCFEIDDYDKNLDIFNGAIKTGKTICDFVEWPNGLIEFLESLRVRYLQTKDIRYWKELIRWLPESWLQMRTVTMTYENLLAMCSRGQRRFHKLNEWSGKDNHELSNFIDWTRSLPYAQELIFLDELDEVKELEENGATNSLIEAVHKAQKS